MTSSFKVLSISTLPLMDEHHDHDLQRFCTLTKGEEDLKQVITSGKPVTTEMPLNALK